MIADKSSYDLLDMNNYKVEKLPVREKTKFEKWMSIVGGSLAIIVFILLYWFIDSHFLSNIDPSDLGKSALKRLSELGTVGFSRANYAMLAIFAAAIILWITEAIPNYLTSFILIITMVLTNVETEVDAYHQLGHKVMWLNILSFILANMLVKNNSLKQFFIKYYIPNL